ncbi:MAG: hypothetical protein ACD_42C00498G0002 [uncultured bacterium]|nr:MAG: hypothetical protein ACD_42C00498G0002 [uncultured bacterium]
MQYWHSVIDEVLHKDEQARSFFFTNHGRLGDIFEDNHPRATILVSRKCKDGRIYALGKKFPELYLTRREAETMFWVVQDFTLAYVAQQMTLSRRTVEFYVKNLKLKLQCRNKKELIETILQTDLLRQLELEGLQIMRH